MGTSVNVPLRTNSDPVDKVPEISTGKERFLFEYRVKRGTRAEFLRVSTE